MAEAVTGYQLWILGVAFYVTHDGVDQVQLEKMCEVTRNVARAPPLPYDTNPTARADDVTAFDPGW